MGHWPEHSGHMTCNTDRNTPVKRLTLKHAKSALSLFGHATLTLSSLTDTDDLELSLPSWSAAELQVGYMTMWPWPCHPEVMQHWPCHHLQTRMTLSSRCPGPRPSYRWVIWPCDPDLVTQRSCDTDLVITYRHGWPWALAALVHGWAASGLYDHVTLTLSPRGHATLTLSSLTDTDDLELSLPWSTAELLVGSCERPLRASRRRSRCSRWYCRASALASSSAIFWSYSFIRFNACKEIDRINYTCTCKALRRNVCKIYMYIPPL